MNKITWTVKFAVDPSWVADGFNLTNEMAGIRELLGQHPPLAEVIGAPLPSQIKKLQS